MQRWLQGAAKLPHSYSPSLLNLQPLIAATRIPCSAFHLTALLWVHRPRCCPSHNLAPRPQYPQHCLALHALPSFLPMPPQLNAPRSLPCPLPRPSPHSACAPSTPTSAAHALLGGAEAVHRGQLRPSCHQRTRPHTPHQHGGLLPGAGGRGEAGGEGVKGIRRGAGNMRGVGNWERGTGVLRCSGWVVGKVSLSTTFGTLGAALSVYAPRSLNSLPTFSPRFPFCSVIPHSHSLLSSFLAVSLHSARVWTTCSTRSKTRCTAREGRS